MKIEDVARVAHEVHKAYCEALDDYSQRPWEIAPEWQRRAAVSGVRYVIGAPHAHPEEAHAKWCLEKRDNGWTYGPVKDAERCTHPDMVAFEDLPLDAQVKSHLFIAVVQALVEEPL